MMYKSRRRKMRERKRISRCQAITTLAALSVLTVAISAVPQHSQPILDVAEEQSIRGQDSPEAHRHLEPRRKPPSINRAKRINALPPVLTNMNQSTVLQYKQPTQPVHQKKQRPFYPSLKTGTCLNDNNYPDYYLYDVKTYFFQSPQECCEIHFGNTVGKKGGGILKAGGLGKCLAAISGSRSVDDMTKMMPVVGSLGSQQPGMKTPGGGHAMFNAAKTGKMSLAGSSGAMDLRYSEPIIDAGSSVKMLPDPKSMGGSKPDKEPQHPGKKMFPKPPMAHWSSSTVSKKGEKTNGHKGSNPAGKKMPPKMYPRPMMPNEPASMEKSGKIESMPGSSFWSSPEMNEMPTSPSWGPDSKTSKLPEMKQMMPPDMPDSYKKSNKYVMPPKRPPPPGLKESQGWNQSWNRPPPHPEMQAKSGKAKSHKSSKSKSSKSKSGKAKSGSPWWDDYTSSPTYMPTEGNDAYHMGWMGGGGTLPHQMPGGRPGYGKPGYGKSGNMRPEYGKPPSKPGHMRPNGNWWGSQQQQPEKPVNKPDWGGGKPSGEKPIKEKPGYWWGGQQSRPERPYWGETWEKPGWGEGSKPISGSSTGWGNSGASSGKPGWGNGWGGTSWGGWGYDGGWNLSNKPDRGQGWGSGWWGGWGGASKPPMASVSSSSPTTKPTGLFPTETLQPTNAPYKSPSFSPTIGVSTYAPTKFVIPTYSPTPDSSTYSPTPVSLTVFPTPGLSTYEPTSFTYSPTEATYYPSVVDSFPTLNPTLVPSDNGDKTPSPDSSGGIPGIPTFSPTITPTEEGADTPSPTSEAMELCVWGSASSAGSDVVEYLLVPESTGLFGVDVSAGSKYSLIIQGSGLVSASGYIDDFDNYHGHLGISTDDLQKGENWFQKILRVFDESKGEEIYPPMFEKVFAGVENFPGSGIMHTILLDSKGRPWGTGSNSKGQLCLGDESDRLIPVMINIEGVRIVDVAIGGEHTLLLDDQGNVFGCGSNEMGQLGLTDTVQSNIPLKLYNIPPSSSISSGRDHSLFIAKDGAYVVGGNEFGQLCVDTKGEPLLQPQKLDIPIDVIESFDAIFSSSYILFSDGSVIGCGANDVGQLGNGKETELATFEPTVVETGGFVVSVLGTGPSAKSVFFITTEKPVYGTGLNSNGQLGVGDMENRHTPSLVQVDSGVGFSLISVGEDHTLALCTEASTPPQEGVPTFFPTYLDRESLPTFSPTYLTNETLPTPSPTYLTAEVLPTLAPTYLTTENVTSSTYSPTPSYSSYLPTTYAPTAEGFNFFFWGNSESIGQESDENVTTPLTIDGDVSYASAGSRYSIIVMVDGSALCSGVIESLEDYRGHFGVNTETLVLGINSFQLITNILDSNETLSNAPAFQMVFAGVERIPDSGIIHTILLDRQGNAYATGSNSKGQLCLGDEDDRSIPTLISLEGPFIDVAVGGEHTLLLHENGAVYVCGNNDVGQLGLGDGVSRTSSPTMLDVLSSVVSVSAGVEHSLFMAEDGIFVTGDNSYGQLCSNSTNTITSPMLIDIPIKNIVTFEAIKFSSYILYIDGSINACGKNDFGQLGDGTKSDQILTEVVINEAVRAIYTGPSSESVFFVTEDETMYSTGLNSWGNLGVGDSENRAIPARVKFEDQVITSLLSPSDDHTIAFGLVTGSLPPTSSPTPAPTFPITPSPTRDSMNFFFWGAPQSLGQTSSDDVTKPLFVEEDAVRASTGSRYTLIVLQDGVVLAGGFVQSKDKYQGHLGLGSIVIAGENDFKEISNIYNGDGDVVEAPDFDQVFAGVERIPDSGIIHTILLDRQGNAYATGSNSKGQLCLGDEDDRSIPTLISLEGPFIDVAVGGEHTLLLHENGAVYVCGSNDVGQLGLGDGVSKTSSPTMLDVLSSVVSVSAGVEHSLFMAEDGIFVTGDNSYGQLCIETDGDAVFVPEMLDNSISKVLSFEAIRSSTFILDSDGLVEACGDNSFGQLGDGTNETIITTSVSLDAVVKILGTGPSSESVFFVTEDEKVYGTGLNSRGNLGIGNAFNQNVPTRVKFPNEVMISFLSAAHDHTVALGLITGTVEPTATPTIGSTTATPSSTPTLSPSRLTEVPTEAPTDPPSATPTMTPSEATATESPTISEGISTSTPTNSLTSSNTYTPTNPVSESTNANLYAWGAQESYGLPTGEVSLPESLDKTVIDVSGGSKYSLILLSDGTAQSSGFIDSMDDYHGHLGVKGSDVSEGSNEFQDISNSFDNSEIISSPPFTRVFAGVEHTDSPGSIHSFFIDDQGKAWATGSNANGELCLGDNEDRLIPTRVTLNGNVISVAIGAKHTILLLDDGTVYTCGSNEDGQLAIAEAPEAVRNTPTKVEDLKDVRMISAGIGSSLFLASDGMYVAGNNAFGQLCVETNAGSLYEATKLEGVNAPDVASFEAIATSSYILFEDGSVGACGRNNFGQLADGTNDDKTRVVVNPIPDGIPIRRLGVGPSSQSTFFINDDGSIYATGLNDRGQLGVGDTENKNTLTLVEYNNDFSSNNQVSAAVDHTLAR